MSTDELAPSIDKATRRTAHRQMLYEKALNDVAGLIEWGDETPRETAAGAFRIFLHYLDTLEHS